MLQRLEQVRSGSEMDSVTCRCHGLFGGWNRRFSEEPIGPSLLDSRQEGCRIPSSPPRKSLA